MTRGKHEELALAAETSRTLTSASLYVPEAGSVDRTHPGEPAHSHRGRLLPQAARVR